ncbi:MULTISPECIES: ATP-binding protein [Caulobacter]|jgi:signal transduction histidine kinase|uniref:Sensory/regulatory protein RpfC n=1 Tax=Caulobacter vibrioides OR37 TaxID=1292034 RepID=R0CYF8_CAUVI|nr:MULTISPECIES: ATP-binding protein [Caulobacter]ENZ81511.1 signal transduction histidine kinase [Caulobacter vibrioides OR37]MBQ1562183.1 response regulator [Caulobacter sp.]
MSAYVPIARGYLLASSVYYLLITLSHPFYEKGMALVALDGLAAFSTVYAAATGFSLRRLTIIGPPLEAMVLGMNALFLANTLAYQILHFEPQKLVYCVLMALVFATSAPSRRVAVVSVAAALAALAWMIPRGPSETTAPYMFVGVAGGFAATGVAIMIRGVVGREVRARLASEALNVDLERQLAENHRLRAEAQALALAAEAANRAKTEFLATMSHEIRTPLNGVLGMAQIMESGELDTDQRQRLDTITASGRSLLAVINAILDLSKIEAGRMDITAAPFDLPAQMETLNHLYGGLARDKGLDFTLTVAPGAAGWRLGDAERLRQVLSNLISNAVKFTESGAVRVTIDGDGARVRAQVVDTGPGVPEDQRQRLFTKFAQLDSSSTRRIGGSGLGLAICKTLVELMGGEIAFFAPPDGGAGFSMDLPMPETSPASRVPGVELAAATTTPDDATAPRVLVVDDNQTNRAVLLTLLNHLGVVSGFAVDGRDAVAMWEKDRWDAILMDVHMPVMDGVAASRAIREAEKRTGRERTPIVAVTASVLPHERALYTEAGMDALTPKPVEVPRLVETLARVMAIEPAPQDGVEGGAAA